MSGRRRQAGRIRTCDRDTNDIVELLFYKVVKLEFEAYSFGKNALIID